VLDHTFGFYRFYYLLRYKKWCSKNKAPVTRKGAITISEAGLPVKLLKKIPAAINAITNKKPPISSHFHEMIRTAIKIKAGILCMIKHIKISLTSPSSKQSRENTIINRIATMARIRGDQ
jgi:hypothetical protein